VPGLWLEEAMTAFFQFITYRRKMIVKFKHKKKFKLLVVSKLILSGMLHRVYWYIIADV
jgi:hypothetical protein